MPRISEATVEEHRRKTMNALLDSAELIVRTKGPDALTACAVAQGAGIARNSIYRYVKDMDDLRRAVLHRHLPQWEQALTDGLADVDTPEKTIVEWVRINLEQDASHGHDWLMGIYGTMSESAKRTGESMSEVSHKPEFHNRIDRPIADAWRRLNPDSADTGVALTKAMVIAGMQLLKNHGTNCEHIITDIVKATQALVDALR
jgi:AcrR family transcriptional regulator